MASALRSAPAPRRGLLALALASAALPACALDDGLARTPPMGWNSWGRFRCGIDERIVRETADAMATNGMKAAGYDLIIVDDCWQIARDAEDNILADPARFPSGMKALADHVHSRGFKFGLYSCAGYLTCQGRPGSRGREFQDARLFARWGVDYLKHDWCNDGGQDPRAAYTTMRDALRATGRPVVFHICEWGKNTPWRWGRVTGHLWRTAPDILDIWESPSPEQGLGVIQILDLQHGREPFAGPGRWNDPDMLMTGNGGMTIDEYRAQFSLWCILAAPLIAGCDARAPSPATLEILTNPEAIAVDQDPLGQQGRRIRAQNGLEAWCRALHDGSCAIALLNRTARPARIAIDAHETGMPPQTPATLRDLWRHEDIGPFLGTFEADVPPHAALLLRATPIPPLPGSTPPAPSP